MRQIALDVETTGIDPALGHKIIEIGCIEIVERKIAGNFHRYFNPNREIDREALQVHNITRAQLASQPVFSDCCQQILDFVRGAELIIHNAPFDLGFLDVEFNLAGRGTFLDESGCKVIDTLELARNTHPGLRNSLDALCERYSVNNDERAQAHNALLDARLLTQVYLAMTGGQISMSFGSATVADADAGADMGTGRDFEVPVIPATPEEVETHRRFMERISGGEPD